MSGKNLYWKSYVTLEGDFELPNYLFNCLNDLMKSALDFGTMLSTDPAKLRSFKEQTKNTFKKRWMEVAEALEYFDIISPCGCEANEYCRVCNGSRYRLNEALSPDEMREISVVVSDKDQELIDRLAEGLLKALKDPQVIALSTM